MDAGVEIKVSLIFMHLRVYIYVCVYMYICTVLSDRNLPKYKPNILIYLLLSSHFF